MGLAGGGVVPLDSGHFLAGLGQAGHETHQRIHRRGQRIEVQVGALGPESL